MKPKFIFCLTLVLIGGLFGCATRGTKVLDYSSGDSAVAEENVVLDLGKQFSIRASAGSWEELIQKVKPTFAWNGCDMMWIETDHRSQPEFILDEAYVFQSANQPRQWVLLEHKTNVPYKDLHQESPRFFYSCRNLYAVAPLLDSIPPVQNDAGERGNYAVMIGANPRYGSIYEIGWQNEMCIGVSHPDYGRRIYLFKDRSNNWRFLGEGPAEGWSRDGGNTLESKAIWNDSSSYPFEIRFHSEEVSYPIGYSADDTNRPPDVMQTNEYVLAGKFPARLRELK